MSRDLIRLCYLIVFVAIVWWGLLSFFARSGRARSMLSLKLGWGVVAILLCFGPGGGLPLWQSAYGIWTNPSLPLVGLVGAGLGQHLFGFTLLQPADRRAIWMFGALTGTALYLPTTLFGGMDLYYWGWNRHVAVAVLAIAGIAFLALGNRAGILLLAAMIAFALGALESPNCWDYVVDPFYWLISLGVIARECMGWWLKRGHQTV